MLRRVPVVSLALRAALRMRVAREPAMLAALAKKLDQFHRSKIGRAASSVKS